MILVDRARASLSETKNESEKREALEKVIDECVSEGILTELLTERREEIIVISILNYDQMAHEQALHDDGYEEGIGDGVLLGMLKTVQKMMKNMGVSLEKAMDTLEIAGEDWDAISKAINGSGD